MESDRCKANMIAEEDLRIEISEFTTSKRKMTSVMLTHNPTGLCTRCTSDKGEESAYNRALENLINLLKNTDKR